jgi:hypothetical protein
MAVGLQPYTPAVLYSTGRFLVLNSGGGDVMFRALLTPALVEGRVITDCYFVRFMTIECKSKKQF